MSQYFVRCPHCAFPHAADADVCPVTGKAMELRRAPSTPPGSERPGASPLPPTAASPTPPAAASAPTPPAASPSPPAVASPAPPAAASPVPAAPSGSHELAPSGSQQLSPSGSQPFLSPAVTPTPGLGPVPIAPMLIPAGTVIGGGYVIGKAIGGGGMAVVYEGEELHNGRPVAVKVLPLHLVQSEESTKRFLKEARISASLSHPNICRILHFGTLEDGRPYYVMELLQGESLSERISREGALPMLEGVEIVMQLLAGLREAHRNGIVHRDVKPGNVFLHDRADGRQMVKLLDFGVSKDVVAQRQESEDTTQLTQTGMIWGTPFYFAPEQALGSRLLDSRVDLWGAGVVLYEVLTGRKPFMAPTYPGLLAKITAEPAVPVTKLRPAAAPEFDRLLDKALAKNPLERYANAAEFLRDLQAVRVGLLGGAEAR